MYFVRVHLNFGRRSRAYTMRTTIISKSLCLPRYYFGLRVRGEHEIYRRDKYPLIKIKMISRREQEKKNDNETRVCVCAFAFERAPQLLE